MIENQPDGIDKSNNINILLLKCGHIFSNMEYKEKIIKMRTATIHTRIQPNLKARAERIFAESGHTTSDIIEQLYIQTVRQGKVPIRLNKRRANIPDEALMTSDEIKKLLTDASGSAKRQIASNKYITTKDIKKQLKEKYAINL
ncbi:type II toxin-antitoxin system RelB/DinJ family antitoxin [Candidatus Saccharibacteria bacterium]|nr:type II toxin-antitoxin system RelB/DinJ family antitoxin [Candidatus Saccharibacteria bacterium]